VVLNFFASWCGPCRQETPLLASTARELTAKGSKVQFIGVDVGESEAAGRAFARQAGITYPVGSDLDLSVANGRYGLEGEPHTFFIDANGVVLGSHAGPLDQAVLTSWLHRLAGTSG
jgi:cytochrome c biogenesis protein CcmG, thiol:disulfide interchange protein DsbE